MDIGLFKNKYSLISSTFIIFRLSYPYFSLSTLKNIIHLYV
nr:MAG TPA: hypothetical protein [Caudoviricetes sp.]